MTTAEKWEYGQKSMSRIDKDRQRQRQSDDFLRRYHTETEYKITQCLRSRVGKAIKLSGGSKSHKTMRLLGCTIDYVRQHLEAQFAEGMTWDNHGDWHIDHIIPCAAFDLTDESQQFKCFNYTNLQPLWASDNMSKGARIL